MDLEKLIRPNIRELNPYSSARDEYSGTGHIFLDANENPVETGLNRYPDPHHKALKKRLSALKNIKEDRIFLGNGSDEPIDLLIRLFCVPGKDSIMALDPSYGMYKVAASINDVQVVLAPLQPDFTLDAQSVIGKLNNSVKIIFLCSPNNPSGNLLDRTEINKILDHFQGIVVVDEAYIDFATDPGFLPVLNQFSNLVILQTFSKAWGLAGLRVGMAFAHPIVISYLNKIKPPYNLNTLSQESVLKALDKADQIRRITDDIITQRDWLRSQLDEIPAVTEIFPSDSNFLLVKLTDAGRLFSYLTQEGIIVRDRSGVKHSHDCLRFTIGLKNENKELVDAIKNFYA